MLAPAIARGLRDRGHDVQAVRERPDLRGASDRQVFGIAQVERRAVVTSNVRDLRPFQHEALGPGGSGHPGARVHPGTGPRCGSPDRRRPGWGADAGRCRNALRRRRDDTRRPVLGAQERAASARPRSSVQASWT
ncbi:MAG: DUF5615 family PIN-like protein [Thermoleophilia bacterium]|nr:DUF5615 family PIN-like protein [Thermoleophilia bacterium]